MVSYLTTVGLSPKAVINGIWAAVSRNVKIDELILFGTQNSIEESVPLVKEKLKEFVPIGKIITVPISEENVVEIMERMKRVIGERQRRGRAVCIDITGGRKTMSAAALASAYFTDASFVYYFWLKNMEKQDKYYPELDDGDYKFVKIPVIGIPELEKYKGALKIFEGGEIEVKKARGLGVDQGTLRSLDHHGYIREIKGQKVEITELGKTLLKVL